MNWWTKTWNPITGCTKISPGCTNCYAERFSKRLRGRAGYPADDPFRVTAHREKMDVPRWRKHQRVFCGSMTDLWQENINPFGRWILIDRFERNPQHVFITSTKRPAQAREDLLENAMFQAIPPNWWFLVSVESQEYTVRLNFLMDLPVAVKGVALEPLLGPVNLSPWINQLDWIVIGGETGPGARVMKQVWAADAYLQAKNAGVPVFFKQWGARFEEGKPTLEEVEARPGLLTALTILQHTHEYPEGYNGLD